MHLTIPLLPLSLPLSFPLFTSLLPPTDEPILSFQRNAFLTLKEERNLLKKQDPNDPDNCRKAIDFLYHEVS